MDFAFMAEAFPQIVGAIPITLLMVFVSAAIGWVLGLLFALVRRADVQFFSQAVAVFISFMRSVPSVILLYISYYVMPAVIYFYGQNIGIEINVSGIPAVVYAIAALTLNQAAYASEVFRSAIAAVDEGQFEASYSIGMNKTQALQKVILPQAMATAMPNLGGLFIMLIKDTSLAYYVGVYEITATANLLSMPTLNFIEAYIMTTVIYEVLSFVFNQMFRAEENHLKRFRAVLAAQV
ncbi:MAG: amino acid ABC transporter permease [Butyrivibrio sp.]|jgi:His/Glu/Gln/Arg/opine family amino acid ABC transporter permease subunit|nr:amino acid ABC transporter permease [Butyrivibrio sp.]